MELLCSLTLFLVLSPLGTQSHITKSYRDGACDTYVTSAYIQRHGILRIENEFLEYFIPLPTDIDETWLTYRLGEEYAHLGNCAPRFHPFEDQYCEKIMAKIALVGGL